VADAITNLRESGDIPWDAIVDETRSLDNYTGWSSLTGWPRRVLERGRARPVARRCAAHHAQAHSPQLQARIIDKYDRRT
jgi:hypothetical protein